MNIGTLPETPALDVVKWQGIRRGHVKRRERRIQCGK
jgi:hypothetical protein